LIEKLSLIEITYNRIHI